MFSNGKVKVNKESVWKRVKPGKQGHGTYRSGLVHYSLLENGCRVNEKCIPTGKAQGRSVDGRHDTQLARSWRGLDSLLTCATFQ
jgi:hypothetical protein